MNDVLSEIIIPCLLTAVSCGAFAIQFNIRPAHLACASVGAFMSEFIFRMLELGGASETKCSLAAAAAAAVYSEIMARRLHVPANMYLITAIIPLVPGGMMYYTMSALILSDIDTASELALRTGGIAGSIAMGIFMVSSAVRLLKYAADHSEHIDKDMRDKKKSPKKLPKKKSPQKRTYKNMH